MAKIYGVRFRSFLKMCYYSFGEIECGLRNFVVCKTKNGLEYGQVCHVKSTFSPAVDSENIDSSGFVRLATDADVAQNEKNLEFEKQAFSIAKDCVKKHNLAMKLVLVVSTFDRMKLIFLFIASGRVDFRKLVRDLASIFRVRVELRQIGIRDEAKILGGVGICGRLFCCSSCLDDFNHVSIKMAKIQNLSLNPRKISGCCGRLMCCLQHEYQAYISLNGQSFNVGDKVLTKKGEGVVLSRNLLLSKVKVRFDYGSGSVVKIFDVSDVKKAPCG